MTLETEAYENAFGSPFTLGCGFRPELYLVDTCKTDFINKFTVRHNIRIYKELSF